MEYFENGKQLGTDKAPVRPFGGLACQPPAFKYFEGRQARELETMDLFMDHAMFSASKDMVEGLRNDIPELALKMCESEKAMLVER